MGMIFMVVGIAVAVIGIMFICTREPYEGMEIYSRYK